MPATSEGLTKKQHSYSRMTLR